MRVVTMSRSRTAIMLWISLSAVLAGVARADDRLPNYQPVSDWPKLPADIKLGAVSAVATDVSDRVYVLHRGPRPVLVFERDGRFLRSWGDDLLKTPHGLRIDHDGHF